MLPHDSHLLWLRGELLLLWCTVLSECGTGVLKLRANVQQLSVNQHLRTESLRDVGARQEKPQMNAD